MKNIIIPRNLNLSPDQIEKLKTLGNLELCEDPNNSEEWFDLCINADIICSESEYMKTEVYRLNNKFFIIPMVGYSWLDIEKLNANNITVANCPGCNKYAVSEWIIAMLINLLKGLPSLINTTINPSELNLPGIGLRSKRVTILGKGNIGTLVGNICESFGMEITFFEINDNLSDKTKNADIIINCLSTNPSTTSILNREFFSNLTKGVYLVSITPSEIFDINALFEAIDQNIIAGMATDCASISPSDTLDENYLRFANHPQILATPHITFESDTTRRDANNIILNNIETWIAGNPINIIN